MKLPQRVKISVQSLPREDVGSRLAVGRAMAGAAQSLSNMTANIFQVNEEAKKDRIAEQIRSAGLSMAERMIEFDKQYAGKTVLSPDEIPEGVDVRRTRKTVSPDGVIIEEPRTEIPAYEVMPQLYSNYAKTHLDAIASEIEDEETREKWVRESQLKIEQEYVDRLTRSREEQHKFNQETVLTDIELALAEQQYDIASSLIDDISDPNVRKKYEHKVEFERFSDYFNELMIDENADPETLVEAISELRNPDISMPLSDAQRLAKANALEQNLVRVTAAAREKEERAKQKAVSDTWLLIDAADPSVDEAYIDQMFDDNLIDGGTRTAMIRALNKLRDEELKRIVTQLDLDILAQKGYGIDPKDNKAREAVDVRYADYVEQTGDPWGSATQIMKEFKVVPSDIISMFRSANRADAPNLAKAVELFIDAQDHAPESLDDFSQGEVDYIEDIAANVRLGMDIPAAVEAVKRWRSLSPQERAALDRNSKLIVESNSTRLKDQISNHPAYDIPWSFKDPEPNSFMIQEYESLVQRYLPSVGFNIGVAQNKAFGEISKKWRLTNINGDYSLMKNMPSAPVEDVRSEMKEQYKGQLGEFNQFYGRQFKHKDIKIFSDALTEIQMNNGEIPTYAAYLMVDEENGVIEALPRFTWDAEAVTEKRRNKIIQEAQAEREKYMRRLERKKRQKEIEDELRRMQWERASNMPFTR